MLFVARRHYTMIRQKARQIYETNCSRWGLAGPQHAEIRGGTRDAIAIIRTAEKMCQFGCVRILILFNAVARVLFTALQLGVSSPTQSQAIQIFDENSSTEDASTMSKNRTTRMIQNGQCWVSTSDSQGLSGSEDLQSWRQNGDESRMHNYLHGNCTAFSGLRQLGLRGHFT